MSIDYGHGEAYNDASKSYNERNYSDAFAKFMMLAEWGCVMSLPCLATMYFRGEWVAADPPQGLEMLERACSLGDPDSAYNLGALNRKGNYGVSIDLEKSRKYFLLAKELGIELDITPFI